MVTASFFFGHSLFEFWHILYLVISIAIIVAGSILSIKYLKIETLQKICLIIGICTELMKAITYVVINEGKFHGYLSKTDLPFNLCSIQLLLFALLVFVNNEKVRRALRGFMLPTCLVGGGMALILATSSSLQYPTITIQYFGFHCAIIVYAIYLLSGKAVQFTIKDYVRTLIILVCTLLVAIYINSILSELTYVVDSEGKLVDTVKVLNINYMYVVHGPKDNLPFLNTSHGWLVYLVHYTLTCVIAVTACYIKPIINAIKERKVKASN